MKTKDNAFLECRKLRALCTQTGTNQSLAEAKSACCEFNEPKKESVEVTRSRLQRTATHESTALSRGQRVSGSGAFISRSLTGEGSVHPALFLQNRSPGQVLLHAAAIRLARVYRSRAAATGSDGWHAGRAPELREQSENVHENKRTQRGLTASPRQPTITMAKYHA